MLATLITLPLVTTLAGLAPSVGAAHGGVRATLVIDGATLLDDGWWFTSAGHHNATLTVEHNTTDPDSHDPIGRIAIRPVVPEGRVNIPGAEAVGFVNGSALSAPGTWTVTPRNVDARLDRSSGDDVAETLEIDADGAGLPPTGTATFAFLVNVTGPGPITWTVRVAETASSQEREVHRVRLALDDGTPQLVLAAPALPDDGLLATNAAALWFNGTLREPAKGVPSGLGQLALVLDGPVQRTIPIAVSGSGAFAHRLDLLALAEGRYELAVVAPDRAGNDGGVNTTLELDRTTPITTWTSPQLAAARPVVLQWNVTDPVGTLVGVDLVRFVNGAWVVVAADTLETSLAVPSLLHGDEARYRLVARDAAGNVEAHPPGPDEARDHIVLVDLVGPEIVAAQAVATSTTEARVTVTARDTTSGLAGATLELLARQGAGSRVVRTLDADPDAQGTYTFVLDGSELAPGTYGAQVTVRDRAGHERQPPAPLAVPFGDQVPLTVQASAPPAGQSAFRAGQRVDVSVHVQAPGEHTVTVDATELGIDGPVQLADDGQGPDARADDGVHTARLTILEGPQLATLTLTATSTAGATGSASLLVPVDDQVPQVTLLEPAAGTGPVGPELTLRVEVTDDRPGVEIAAVRVDGDAVDAIVTPDRNTGGLQLLVDVADLPHGDVELEIIGRDTSGNEARTLRILEVDATPPELVPKLSGNEAPAPRWFRGPVRIEVQATDPESGALDARIAVDDGPFRPGPVTLTAPGPHEVRLSAVNGVGLRAVTTLVVGIDGAEPRIDRVARETRQGADVLVVEASDDVAVANVTATFAVQGDAREGTGAGPAKRVLTRVGEEYLVALPEDLSGDILVEVSDQAGNQVATTFKAVQKDTPTVPWALVAIILALCGAGRGARWWQR